MLCTEESQQKVQVFSEEVNKTEASPEKVKKSQVSPEKVKKTEVALEEIKKYPTELSNRHPLQSRWALWYLKGDRHKNWEECLKLVSMFDTVEEFWA